MLDADEVATETSPFGGPARLVQTLPAAYVAEMYRKKCGVDVTSSFHGHQVIRLYECEKTGYRFWRPAEIAGDESVYRRLSAAWPNYYRKNSRWEHAIARSVVKRASRLLEIGCGPGYFLQSTEGLVRTALGIELNREAIERKVTRFPIEAITVQEVRDRSEKFDAICSFQVLEHISEPYTFLEAARECLSPGGVLVLSTPNADYQPFHEQADAFDLPPHHMGHFDERAFRRIAQILSMDLVRVQREPRRHEGESATGRTRGSLAFKLARGLGTVLYDAAYRLTGEPGPTLVAVLRRP